MTRRCNIVATGFSNIDWLQLRFGRPDHMAVSDATTWGVGPISDVIVCDRKYNDAQGALADAIADKFDEIGLWGCDYRVKGGALGEPGEDEMHNLIRLAVKSGIRFNVASSSTILDKYDGPFEGVMCRME